MQAEILRVAPGAGLQGEVGPGNGLPGDKSLSHRAALFAALAEGESRIENFLVSGVTQAMLEALTALQVPWELEGSTLTVQGRGLRGWTPLTEPVIYCGNSATTLRLLAGALAAWGIAATLDGSPGLRRRPMGRIVEPLRQMGVEIDATDGCAPLILRPGICPLRPLDYSLPVASAQVKSCLLLAALAASGPTTLTEPGPSRDHTERLLSGMGVKVNSHWSLVTGDQASVGGGRASVVELIPLSPLALAPLCLELPGDISAAAFLIVAALITPGSQIVLRGVGLNPTRSGLLDALQAMGAEIQISNRSQRHGEACGDLMVRASRLHGVQVGGDLVVRMIDEFPAFAVAAAYAQGETVVCQAEELRLKESDRISALCQELRKLGVQVSEAPDGFTVQGGQPPHGAVVDPHGDHRLAMALAVAGLAAQEPVEVQGAGIIQESFPDFAAVLARLGAEVG